MNAKAAIPLVLAVVLGLVAAIMVRNAIANKKTAAVQPTNLVSVVVAKQDVEPGHELTKDDITISKIPADVTPGHVFSDPTQLVGRVPTAELVKGQTILETLLSPSGNGSGLQALVPPGMRAVTLEATEYSAVGGMLHPGCRIDVISVVRNEKTGGQIARTVLQNLLVSAIGHNVTANPPAPTADNSGTPPPPSNVNAITLVVTPKQAQVLQMAMISGRPWFSLRSGRDQKQVDVEGTTLAELRGEDASQGDAVASASPNQTTIQTQAIVQQSTGQDSQPTTIKRTVQVIRGGAESNVTFVLPAPRGLSVGVDGADADLPSLAPAK